MSRIIKFSTLAEEPIFLEHHALALVAHSRRQEQQSSANLGVLQAAMEDAQQQACTIVAEAQKKASAIMDEAVQQTEILKSEGHDIGYQTGFDKGQSDGYIQGIEKANREIQHKLQEVNHLVVTAQAEAKATVLSSERQIVDIALSVARKILAREIEENPMVVLPIVKAALEKVCDQEQITIKVNPQDYELVQESKLSLQVSTGCQQYLSVIADDAVGVGGCIIDTTNGTVDAKFDTQFETLKKALQDMCHENI